MTDLGALERAAVEHRELIAEALDSHAYWQLSSTWNRNDGYVMDPEAEEPEVRDQILLCQKLEEVFRHDVCR